VCSTLLATYLGRGVKSKALPFLCNLQQRLDGVEVFQLRILQADRVSFEQTLVSFELTILSFKQTVTFTDVAVFSFNIQRFFLSIAVLCFKNMVHYIPVPEQN
jgi:hypothetical protein